MKQSPEIEAVIRRLWDAALARDLPTISNLISREPAVRSIAMADDEWWAGHDLVVGLWDVRVAEAGFKRIELERLEAFEEGSIGWAAGVATAVWPSGETLTAQQKIAATVASSVSSPSSSVTAPKSSARSLLPIGPS